MRSRDVGRRGNAVQMWGHGFKPTSPQRALRPARQPQIESQRETTAAPAGRVCFDTSERVCEERKLSIAAEGAERTECREEGMRSFAVMLR